MYLKFYRCNICGQIIALVKPTGANMKCCEEDMEEIYPNEVDAMEEKHVPYVTTKKNKVYVRIGSDLHPSNVDHHIEWIAIETNKGMQLRKLRPYEVPEATFTLNDDEKLVETFAYCNLHKLWKKEL